MYKVCILAAGKGTRNKYAQDTNKALLPLGKGTALSYIIKKFPKDIEIIVAVGYNSLLVEQYLVEIVWAWHRHFIWKEVLYEGEKRGPGYSLLQCAPLLQCPFVYIACDTIVTGDIPEPNENWIGVAKVKDKLPYLTVDVQDDFVEKVYDKGDKKATYIASIGLVGVKDYKDFWKGLANPTIVQNEHQDTSGINALIPHELQARYFHWLDIGTTEGYEYANRYFSGCVSQ